MAKALKKEIGRPPDKRIEFAPLIVMLMIVSSAPSSLAATKGLSQIVTPDLQGPGDLSLSFQAQSEQIAHPYELQAEIGLTRWAEFAGFRGFKPDDWIFGTD